MHIFLNDHQRTWLCYKSFFFKGLENELDSVLASAEGNKTRLIHLPKAFCSCWNTIFWKRKTLSLSPIEFVPLCSKKYKIQQVGIIPQEETHRLIRTGSNEISLYSRSCLGSVLNVKHISLQGSDTLHFIRENG